MAPTAYFALSPRKPDEWCTTWGRVLMPWATAPVVAAAVVRRLPASRSMSRVFDDDVDR